ncbi:MAG: nucleoside hydrolase [Firmicutes bacterium]|nr:nucleoside hydrolase [Bacillota bacterium]
MEDNQRIPILLDTDIGSDIDDALCLAYLLEHPQCELLGITTVSGEPEKRAMLADAVCRAAGKTNIPIHSGSADPLVIEQRQTKAQQAEVLSQWEHRQDFPSNTAIDFLRETIHSHPGEITLLTIGPLTNIGLLFRVDPEIPRLLKSLVMMAGVYTSPNEHVRYPVEWNVLLDPHAASIVYATEGLPNVSIGLDVTTQCVLPADVCRRKLTGGALDVVRDAAEVWFRQRSVITFHDPLAAVAIFAPQLMGYADGVVEVELKSDLLAGMTIWDPKAAQKRNRVALEVDSAGFFDEYFRIAAK